MDIQALVAQPPDQVRANIPEFLGSYMGTPDSALRIVEAMRLEISGWTNDEVHQVLVGLACLGQEHILYPANPLCRTMVRRWCEIVLEGSTVHNTQVLLNARSQGPTVVVVNHVSYIDSTVVDGLLHAAGHTELANHLFSAAGPKVYDDLFRRFASGCLHTLPVPQSSKLGHNQAQLSPRQLARLAIQSLRTAHAAMQDDMTLLLYPEGTRTRTERMSSFLKGTWRFFNLPGTVVIPAALVGTHAVMPLTDTRVTPGACQLTFGAPIDVEAAGGPHDALDAAHSAIAAMLPPSMAPTEDTPPSV